VAATFALSIELADTLDPVGLGRPVMVLASLLDPTGIPTALFGTDPVRHYLAAASSEAVDDHAVAGEQARDAVQVLHRLNLLTVDPAVPQRAVRVHALVQRATREAILDQDPHLVAQAARTAADALLELWPVIELVSQLVQALRGNTDALRAVANTALWEPDAHPVLFRAGHSLGEAGLVTSAHSYFQQLHRAAQSTLGPDHPDTLTTRHNLARWRGDAGDPAGAGAATEALLTDYLRVLGPDHPDTLNTRSNLASWRGEAGDPAGAATDFEHLLTDYLRVLGRVRRFGS
jgi:hypothetical protein